MSRKSRAAFTPHEKLTAVAILGLAVVSILLFALSKKDEIITTLSDSESSVPVAFDAPKNFSMRVLQVDADGKSISVEADVEDPSNAGSYETKKLLISIDDETELEKLNVFSLHVNATPQQFTLAELEPGTAIVVSSLDNPQAVSTVHAAAVRQYIR